MTTDDSGNQGLSSEIEKLVSKTVSDIVCLITKQSMKRTLKTWKNNLDDIKQESVDKLERRLRDDLENTRAQSCREAINQSSRLVENAVNEINMPRFGFIRSHFIQYLLLITFGAAFGGMVFGLAVETAHGAGEIDVERSVDAHTVYVSREQYVRGRRDP